MRCWVRLYKIGEKCVKKKKQRENFRIWNMFYFFFFFKSVKCENESVLLASMQFHKEDALLLA